MNRIQQQHRAHASPSINPRLGFTLIELLTVMAILCAISGMGISQLGSSRGMSLTAAGNKLVDYAFLAKQQATSRNAPIALLVLTSDPTEKPGSAYRALTLAELQADGWKQICAWEILRQGIVVDTKSTFLQNATLSALGAGKLSTLSFRGMAVQTSDCAARIFLPSGGLLNPDQSAVIQLVEGYIDNSMQVHYTQHEASGSPANYYSIALLGVTGLSKVDRR